MALAFTKPILQSKVSHLKPYQAELVTAALHRPLRKMLPRVAAREYSSSYQHNEMHNETLLRFAKIDFNLLQKQHLEELCVITRWWKELEVEKNFHFARDRIVESYFWIIGVNYVPQYRLGRKFLCKVIALCSIIDDSYDVYGTPAELQLFTDAVHRWDISAEDDIPAEYMKILYRAMFKVYQEMEEELAKEGRSFAITYAKEEMKRTTKAYLEESKWLIESKTPSMEEYLKVSCPSTCYPMLAVASLVGMGEIANKEAFDWFINDSPSVYAAALICRLMSDIVTHQLERKRKHVPSGVECYMKEFKASAREAYDTFNNEVDDAWFDINQAFLDTRAPHASLLTHILNLARVMDLLYKEEDGYTNPQNTMHLITALLVNPVDI